MLLVFFFLFIRLLLSELTLWLVVDCNGSIVAVIGNNSILLRFVGTGWVALVVPCDLWYAHTVDGSRW